MLQYTIFLKGQAQPVHVQADSFEFNFSPADKAARRRKLCQRRCGDEIDLANFRKGKLLKSRAIAAERVRSHSELKVALGRVEKPQKLRVVQKDVNVIALSMANLQHQRRASAKRPAVYDNGVRINLVNQFTGDGKKRLPV